MNVRKLALCLSAGLVVNGFASASVLVSIEESFESGAAFEGTLTFSDSYDKIYGVAGVLSGGAGHIFAPPGGWNDVPITWSWSENKRGGDPIPIGATGLYGDFLMSGVAGNSGASPMIAIAWELPVDNKFQIVIDPTILSASWAGINDADHAVKVKTHRVPEHFSLPALGASVAALALMRRRKK